MTSEEQLSVRSPDDIVASALEQAAERLRQGEFEDAKGLYKTTTDDAARLDASPVLRLRAKYGWAVAESRLENYGVSKKILHEVLEEQADHLPDCRFDFLQTLEELAHVYRLSTKFGKAKQCYEVAVMDRARRNGRADASALKTLEGLAIVYRSLHRLDEAVIVYRYMLSYRGLDPEREDAQRLCTMFNLSVALTVQDKYDAAVEVLEDAARGFESMFGATHLNTMWVRDHLDDAKRIRDSKFHQLLLHHEFGLAEVLYQRSLGNETGQETEATDEEVVTGDDADKLRRQRTAERSTPSIGHSMLDVSGARLIQLAAWQPRNDPRRHYLPYHPRGSTGEGDALPPDVLEKTVYSFDGFLDVMRDEFGVDVNIMDVDTDRPKPDSGETPLMLAIRGRSRRSSNEAVELLLKRPEVNPNATDSKSRTPLIEAAHWNHIDTVRRLLETGVVDVNHVSNEYSEHANHDTALAAAARNGSEEMVRLLLDAGARDSLPGSKKSALLAVLPLEKYHNIALLLLERASPDVNFRTPSGTTALHQVKNAELCKTLLDMAAVKSINALDGHGRTPLFQASKNVTRVLLDYGADPSIPSKGGDTPLLHAVWGSIHDKIQLLLERSTAEVDVPNRHGETPLSVAFMKGDERSVTLLVKAVATVDFEVLEALENGVHREGEWLPIKPKKPKEEMLQLVRDIM